MLSHLLLLRSAWSPRGPARKDLVQAMLPRTILSDTYSRQLLYDYIAGPVVGVAGWERAVIALMLALKSGKQARP